jgi:hypothetical protein
MYGLSDGVFTITQQSPWCDKSWTPVIIVKKHQNKFWKETCKEDKKNKKTYTAASIVYDHLK